jgi:hypothetical protein
MVMARLPQAEERKNCHYHHDQTDQINQTVHDVSSSTGMANKLGATTKVPPPAPVSRFQLQGKTKIGMKQRPVDARMCVAATTARLCRSALTHLVR